MFFMNRLAAQASKHPWVANSGYLFAATVLGSAFGFIFWTAAARLYSPTQVGRSVSLIAAISLIALLGDMGLSVVLVRHISSHAAEKARFFNTLLSYLLVCTGGIVMIFALFFWFAPNSLSVISTPAHLAVFAAVTLVFTAAQFYDRLFIALQASHWVLNRGVLMHLTRLVVLVALAGRLGEMGMLLAAGVGALISLGASAWSFAPQALPGYRLKLAFDQHYLSGKVRYALGSQVSQLAWGLPALALPLLVAGLLGAEANARFYISWMVANLLFIVPLAVSTAAFASAAAARSRSSIGVLQRATRLTQLGLVLPALGFIFFSRSILSIFGESYAEAAKLLVLFVVSVFPFTLNTFTVNAYRLAGQPWGLVWLPGSISALSLALVAVCCWRYGLVGVGLGWLLGQSLGACLSWTRRIEPFNHEERQGLQLHS